LAKKGIWALYLTGQNELHFLWCNKDIFFFSFLAAGCNKKNLAMLKELLCQTQGAQPPSGAHKPMLRAKMSLTTEILAERTAMC